MTFHIITIFPRIFESYFNESIIDRTQKKKLGAIKIYDLRNWTKDKHRTVDDRPYGGGPGMVMLAEPIIKAVGQIKSKIKKSKHRSVRTILFSAGGDQWKQKHALKYKDFKNLILICGRYEGVDARIKQIIDAEISVGPYVLTGGEIPAMVVVDSVMRLIPGAVGNAESITDESFRTDGLIEYPQYTRPEKLNINGKIYAVPKILLSGNHARINKWRVGKTKIKSS